MADDLGFATKYSKKNPKPITSSRGTQKDIDAIKKRAGVLADAVGQGADDSYKKFTEQRQTQQKQVQQQKQQVQQQAQTQATAQQEAKKPVNKLKVIANDLLVKPVVNTGKAIGNTTASIVQDAQGKHRQAAASAQAASKAYEGSIAKPLLQPVTATRDKIISQTKYLSSPTASAADRKAIIDNQAKAAKSPAAKTINDSSKKGNNTARGLLQAQKQAAQGKDTKTVSKTLADDSKAKQRNDKQAAATAVTLATDVMGGGSVKEGANVASKVTKSELFHGAGKTGGIAAANNAAATVSANPDANKGEIAKASFQGYVGGNLLHLAGHATSTLLNKASDARATKVMATRVDPELVKQGVITGEVKQTPVHEITIGAEHAGKKVDNAKVKQYEKQIKDGEPIEPVVTHQVNGKTVVVDGQHRLAAMQNLGVKEIPTVEKLPGASPAAAPVAMPTAELPGAAEPTTAPVKTAAGELKVSSDPIIASKTPTKAPEPPTTRTLRPSETAHMPEVGGYTHSEHMAQDYADMLRGQEKQAKGGQLLKAADGSYTRTSEHSRFYRDVYKETGRPPTKADYLEHAKKELETGKDGMGAGEDYKKLLEREAKPVERVKVESTVKDVPQGTSKVAQRIAKDLKEKYGELAQYDRITIKDQAAKAEKLINNREELDAVINGTKPLPDGLRATSVITGVRNHPVLSKDPELLLKLAKSPLASESSLSAQELRLAAENAKNDPVESVKKIADIGNKTFEKRTGKKFDAVVKQNTKEVKAAIPPVKAKDWSSFVDSLKC